MVCLYCNAQVVSDEKCSFHNENRFYLLGAVLLGTKGENYSRQIMFIFFSWPASQPMLLPGAVEHSARRALGLLRREVPESVFGSIEWTAASLAGIWQASSTMVVATLRNG